jgi:hypothetical protein
MEFLGSGVDGRNRSAGSFGQVSRLSFTASNARRLAACHTFDNKQFHCSAEDFSLVPQKLTLQTDNLHD